MKHPILLKQLIALLLATALSGTYASYGAGEKISVGVEVLSIEPSIITPEKKKEVEKKEEKKAEEAKPKSGFGSGFGKGIGKGLSSWGKNLNLPGTNNQQVNKAATNTVTQSVIQTPTDPKLAEIKGDKVRVPPKTASLALRQTEAYFLAARLSKLLQQNENVNFVAVIPSAEDVNRRPAVSTNAFDYVLRVKLMHSDGNEVALEGAYFSSVDNFKRQHKLKGMGGNKKRISIPTTAYEGKKDPDTGEVILEKDPYDPALSQVVNAFDTALGKSRYTHEAQKKLTFTRYGMEMAPEVFSDYPIKEKKMKRLFVIETEPSQANPFVQKVGSLHKTELNAHGQFTEHYFTSAKGAELKYNLWRKNTQESLLEFEKLKAAKSRIVAELVGAKLGEGLAMAIFANNDNSSQTSPEDALKEQFAEMLIDSMVVRDGYMTVLRPPSWLNLAENSGLTEHAQRLEDYNNQLVIQAKSVEELQGEFTTLSAPTTIELLTRTETYDGKVDVALSKFRKDLKAEFESEMGVLAN